MYLTRSVLCIQEEPLSVKCSGRQMSTVCVLPECHCVLMVSHHRAEKSPSRVLPELQLNPRTGASTLSQANICVYFTDLQALKQMYEVTAECWRRGARKEKKAHAEGGMTERQK